MEWKTSLLQLVDLLGHDLKYNYNSIHTLAKRLLYEGASLLADVCSHVPNSVPDGRNSETTIPVEICGPFDIIFPCKQQLKEIRSKQTCILDSTLSFVRLDLQFKVA